MSNFFINHAIKNVWCENGLDLQSIVQPARLTPNDGARNTAQVMWRTLTLPLQNVDFHIYQIGQLDPELMGFFKSYQWVTLAQECIAQKMICDVYNNKGIQLPRTAIWYRITPDKDLIIAVQILTQVPINLNTEAIYLKVYTNAYFQTVVANQSNNGVNVVGGVATSSDQILNYQMQYQASKQLPGETYAFVNGYRVSGIDVISVGLGNYVEFVYDSSIIKVIDLPVNQLPTFVSTLDNLHKYLIHYATEDVVDGIEYLNEVDMFLYPPAVSGRWSGIYYHKNQVNSIRMVTHKDYAIPSQYVVGYATDNNFGDPSQLTLRLHVRQNGNNRPLVFDNNRIQELYKLSDTDLVNAMIGLNAVVPNWTAANLEAAQYPAIMSARIQDINLSMVEGAYGYNAMSRLFGYTPQFTYQYSDIPTVNPPYGLCVNSTAYEYDQNGQLLGWFIHDTGSQYECEYNACTLVELVGMPMTTILDETYGVQTQQLNKMWDYRYYVTTLDQNGEPTNQWTDVTGTDQYSVDTNDILTWNVDPGVYYTMVRSNQYGLGYDLELDMSGGLLSFDLQSVQTRVINTDGGDDGSSGSPPVCGTIVANATTGTYVMQVPLGELDIFLNGHSLIENIDYFVQFPQVVIVNKDYLVNPETTKQNITIRFTGFCKSDLTREPAQDVGFVQYGLLSNNNKFDIRDDEVLRIVVGGATWDRSQFQFAETSADVLVPDALNGSPYMIRDIVVPMRDEALLDTYVLRAASEVIDNAVSNYLTLKLPDPLPTTTPDSITSLYTVFSPFCCKIIYDLAAGIINDPRLTTQYTDMDVQAICANYQYLLAYDPAVGNNKLDSRFVVVHPHNLFTPIALTAFQYRFMTNVVRIYFENSINLSQFISLLPAT